MRHPTTNIDNDLAWSKRKEKIKVEHYNDDYKIFDYFYVRIKNKKN